MRAVILNVAISLDGYIEGPNGEFDWCFIDQDYGMAKFLEETDAIFFGRKSYELAQKMGLEYYASKKLYVFSKSFKTEDKNTIVINGDLKTEIEAIKKEDGKAIWLFGGAAFTKNCLKSGLVDELRLAVHPLLLGNGKQLFNHLGQQIDLELIDSKNYSSGLIQLIYRLKKEG